MHNQLNSYTDGNKVAIQYISKKGQLLGQDTKVSDSLNNSDNTIIRNLVPNQPCSCNKLLQKLPNINSNDASMTKMRDLYYEKIKNM